MRIAIIPARGGSRRIPRKNIRDFHGKPIIAHSILTANKTDLFDQIIVSTDDDEIADIASSYGATILRRPPEYCHDDVGTQEVAAQVILQAEANYAEPIDAVCVIYATAPLMQPKDISAGYAALIDDDACTFAFSVNQDPLHDAGQFYWGISYDFIDRKPLVSLGTRLITIAPCRVCDINTEADWLRAEQMWTRLQEGGQ